MRTESDWLPSQLARTLAFELGAWEPVTRARNRGNITPTGRAVEDLYTAGLGSALIGRIGASGTQITEYVVVAEPHA